MVYKLPHTLNLSHINFYFLTMIIFDYVELNDNAFSSVQIVLMEVIHTIMLLMLTVMNLLVKSVSNASQVFAKYI